MEEYERRQLSAAQADAQSDGSQPQDTSVGIIVGGALAGLALVCITVISVVCILKRRTNPTSEATNARKRPAPPPPSSDPDVELRATAVEVNVAKA